MKGSPADIYAHLLAELVGNEFQREVCARVAANILSFQNIPPYPHGDAGLDGLSHDATHGYCCYGPEHHAYKKNSEREKAIIKKFCGDLRKLFELDVKGKKLVQINNTELETILPAGARLQHIKLIANWFESHRVIGPILTKVAEYKAASALRFVAPDASVIVVGPTQLANEYAVDESTLARAQQRGFMQKVLASASAMTINDPKDFDWKMSTLRSMQPTQEDAIQGLAESLRNDWRMSLAFERELDDAAPSLHQALELSRQQIVTRVRVLALTIPDPAAHIAGAVTVANDVLGASLGAQYGFIIGNVATGEVARLIGECTIGWTAPEVVDAGQ